MEGNTNPESNMDAESDSAVTDLVESELQQHSDSADLAGVASESPGDFQVTSKEMEDESNPETTARESTMSDLENLPGSRDDEQCDMTATVGDQRGLISPKSEADVTNDNVTSCPSGKGSNFAQTSCPRDEGNNLGQIIEVALVHKSDQIVEDDSVAVSNLEPVEEDNGLAVNNSDQTVEEGYLAVTNSDQIAGAAPVVNNTGQSSEEAGIVVNSSEQIAEAGLAASNLEHSAGDRVGGNTDTAMDLSFAKRSTEEETGANKSVSMSDQKPCESQPQGDKDEPLCLITTSYSLSDQDPDEDCHQHNLDEVTLVPSTTLKMREEISEKSTNIETQMEDCLKENSQTSTYSRSNEYHVEDSSSPDQTPCKDVPEEAHQVTSLAHQIPAGTPDVESQVEDGSKEQSQLLVKPLSEEDQTENDGTKDQSQSWLTPLSDQDQSQNDGTETNLYEVVPKEIHQVAQKMGEDIPEIILDVADVIKEPCQVTLEDSPPEMQKPEQIHQVAVGQKVAEAIPEIILDVADVRKEQSQVTTAESLSKMQKPEAPVPVQETVINVSIQWTDTETGQTTLLIWDHQSCNICCSTLSDWKQHLIEEHPMHQTIMKKSPKKKSQKVKKIPKVRIPRKAVKKEPLDDTRSLLNISVPALVSLKSLGQKAHKMEVQDLEKDCENAKSTVKQLHVPDAPVIKTETVDGVPTKKRGRAKEDNGEDDSVVPKKRGRKAKKDSAQGDAVVVPKKRGRPKKVRGQDDAVTKQRGKEESEVLTNQRGRTMVLPIWRENKKWRPPSKIKLEEALQAIKRKSEPPKKEGEGDDDTVLVPFDQKGEPTKVEDDVKTDPEYIPSSGQRRGLRPNRAIKFQQCKMYTCAREDCGKKFEIYWDCKKHERKVHGNERIKCTYEGCEKMFKGVFLRDKHEESHVKQLKRLIEGYRCDYCNMTFKNGKDKGFHLKTHIQIKCTFEGCDKKYTSLKEMHRHRKICTVGGYKFPEVPCQLCQKTFKSQKHVNKHIKQFHQEKNFGCDQCHKKFKSQKAVDRHKRLHTGQGLLMCRFCGKKLNGKSSLDRHERVHTGEKPYQCKYCDKRFVCVSSMQIHEQEHTGAQYICSQCGHPFKSKANLAEHELTHCSESTYECEKCDKKFRTKSGQWNHMQAKHSDTKKHKCDVCNKLFWTHGGLYKHKPIHTGIKKSECQYCHKRFIDSSARSAHVKQVHLKLKRTGHQGKPKALKNETLATRLQLEATNPKGKLSVELNPGAKSGTEPSTSAGGATATRSVSEVVRIPEGRAASMMPPSMVPLNLGVDRSRIAGLHHLAPGQIPPPHNPPQGHGDPSRDFYSMVESFMQFSKEH